MKSGNAISKATKTFNDIEFYKEAKTLKVVDIRVNSLKVIRSSLELATMKRRYLSFVL